MTRSARRRRDRVTVDELLRQAGVRPRRPGSRSAEAGRGPAPEPRGAAGRIALATAVTVVLGGIVLALATRPDTTPVPRVFPQLPPATSTSVPAPVAAPTQTTTPSPVVMHARRTETPTPTPTVQLPPSPTTTVTLPKPSWPYPYPPYPSYPSYPDYSRCYPYCDGYAYGGPVR